MKTKLKQLVNPLTISIVFGILGLAMLEQAAKEMEPFTKVPWYLPVIHNHNLLEAGQMLFGMLQIIGNILFMSLILNWGWTLAAIIALGISLGSLKYYIESRQTNSK